jgi:poly(3-hydroxybutyrate) depolymerase
MFALAAVVLAAAAPAMAQQWAEDEWLRQPVDDATFASFLEFFAYDHNLPLEVEVTSTEETAGVEIQHLSFQSTADLRITAVLYRPTGGESGLPAVVGLHGGVATGKASFQRLGPTLARLGWMVLAIDMLHFGDRDTGLFETFMNAEKAERLYNRPSIYLEWLTQTVKDTGRAYDMLVRERAADPSRVVLAGISRGGQMSLMVGGADSRFAGVAALIAGHFDALELGHSAPACPANYIGRIAPRPLFTLNGERDADYDRDLSVMPLHQHAGANHDAHWHDQGHTLPGEQTESLLIEWLGRVPPLER